MDVTLTSKDTSTTTIAIRSQIKSIFEGEVLRITTSAEHLSESFYIHKYLLQRESPYFAALPNFREGGDNHVALDDMTPDVFKVLAYWFYCGSVEPQAKSDPKILVQTWIAADRLLMSKFKNKVMDQLRDWYSREHSEATILEVVEPLGYSTESPLLRYLTDQVAFDCIDKDDAEITNLTGSDWPPLIQGSIAFMLTTKIIAVAQKWRKSSKSGTEAPTDPSRLDLCVYHEHTESEDCYAKTKPEGT